MLHSATRCLCVLSEAAIKVLTATGCIKPRPTVTTDGTLKQQRATYDRQEEAAARRYLEATRGRRRGSDSGGNGYAATTTATAIVKVVRITE